MMVSVKVQDTDHPFAIRDRPSKVATTKNHALWMTDHCRPESRRRSYSQRELPSRSSAEGVGDGEYATLSMMGVAHNVRL